MLIMVTGEIDLQQGHLLNHLQQGRHQGDDMDVREVVTNEGKRKLNGALKEAVSVPERQAQWWQALSDPGLQGTGLSAREGDDKAIPQVDPPLTLIEGVAEV